jgi:hypothetical protein
MHTIYIVQVTRPELGSLLDSAWPTQDAADERAPQAAQLHSVKPEKVAVVPVPFEDSWA